MNSAPHITDRTLEEKKITIQSTKVTETKEKHRRPPWPMPELHPLTEVDEEPQSIETAARSGTVEPPSRRTWITERVSVTPPPRIVREPSAIVGDETNDPKTQQKGIGTSPTSAHEANLPSLPEETRTTPRPDEARRKRR
jgi:hypothetical protein